MAAERANSAECRQLLVLDCERDLEMMARHGLVIDEAA